MICPPFVCEDVDIIHYFAPDCNHVGGGGQGDRIYPQYAHFSIWNLGFVSHKGHKGRKAGGTLDLFEPFVAFVAKQTPRPFHGRPFCEGSAPSVRRKRVQMLARKAGAPALRVRVTQIAGRFQPEVSNITT